MTTNLHSGAMCDVCDAPATILVHRCEAHGSDVFRADLVELNHMPRAWFNVGPLVMAINPNVPKNELWFVRDGEIVAKVVGVAPLHPEDQK